MVANLSLIVPTRKRPDQLRRFLNSIATTAAQPDSLEMVLVTDADDPESGATTHPALCLKHVVLPPGQTMGALNMAGYEASTGRHLMLLNDDVAARTRGWDRIVRDCFAACPDGILLLHVNDLVFQKHLCTFPLVSRTFCELIGGLCPREYRRYRIDDHLEDYFNLLGVLGERRTIYLADVVFEHFNVTTGANGQRHYASDPAILALDAPLFESWLSRRKEGVLKLMEHIDGQVGEEVKESWRARLAEVADPFALRVPERLRLVYGSSWSKVKACVRETGFRGLARSVLKRMTGFAGKICTGRVKSKHQEKASRAAR